MAAAPRVGEGEGVEMLAAKAAAASNDEQRWATMMEAMKELMTATTQMREANAAFQAETRAHGEETQRRLDALEERTEKQSDKAQAREVGALKRQVDLDWKMIAIAASLIGSGLQAAAGILGHIALH